MAAFNKFQKYIQDVHHKVHDLSADAIYIMLTNVAPVATNSVKADLTEIAAGFGYTAGGAASATASSGHTSGVYKLVLTDVTFTASGGSIGPFRYVVFYNNTPTSPADPLIGWYDYGSALTLLDGQSFLVDMTEANGLLQAS